MDFKFSDNCQTPLAEEDAIFKSSRTDIKSTVGDCFVNVKVKYELLT